jgi:cold shock CspA family protein
MRPAPRDVSRCRRPSGSVSQRDTIGRSPNMPTRKVPTKVSWPNAPRGEAATGRIGKILVGQGHGFIRLRDNREVFFHRRDVKDGVNFNDLEVGQAVSFELLEDSVSGARALAVAPAKAKKR